MNDRLTPEDEAEQIRAELHAVIKRHGISLGQAADIFTQCASMLRESLELLGIAASLGLKLGNFSTDEHLELYFNIYRGQQRVGFISRAWSDPDFRLGNVLFVPTSKVLLLQVNRQRISRLCKTHGIIVTTQEKFNPVKLYLESVIYKKGFNKKVFSQTLKTLTECGDKVREMLLLEENK